MPPNPATLTLDAADRGNVAYAPTKGVIGIASSVDHPRSHGKFDLLKVSRSLPLLTSHSALLAPVKINEYDSRRHGRALIDGTKRLRYNRNVVARRFVTLGE